MPAVFAGLLLLVLAAVGGWLWWSPPDAPQTVPSVPPPPPVAASVPAAAPAMAEPALPEPMLAADDPAALQAAEVEPALRELLGADAVLRFLLPADFPRRFVATVDNLGRDHAPVAAWPVLPTAGRFEVDGQGETTTIADANASRYAPLVGLVGSLDAVRTVALFRRMEPLLQRAYRDLGFGDRRFDARLLEVIDLLLATPEPQAPIQVKLTHVKGPIPSTRPWTRYEFTDPRLQSLAAGQKVLLRVGAGHRAVLKGKLRELRAALRAGAQGVAR